MPIYEYRCLSCEKVFEFTQRMSDDPKTECEECGGRLERLISQTAFHLKGGGWYKDLYSSTKKDSGASGGGSDKAAASTSPSSDTSSGESKSASSGSDSSATTSKKPSGSESAS